MGFSHFWYLDNTDSYAHIYDKAKKDIIKIIIDQKNILGDAFGENKPKIDKDIAFNGLVDLDDACESFYLPEKLSHLNTDEIFLIKHNKFKNLIFQSCKTRYLNYDKVVVACLAVLFDYLAPYNKIIISSDGDESHWVEGVELAESVLKRKFNNPMSNEILSLMQKRRNQLEFIENLKSNKISNT